MGVEIEDRGVNRSAQFWDAPVKGESGTPVPILAGNHVISIRPRGWLSFAASHEAEVTIQLRREDIPMEGI